MRFFLKLKLAYNCFFFCMVVILMMSGCRDNKTDCEECPTCEGCPDAPNYTEANKFIQQWMYFVYYWNTKIDSKLLKNSQQFNDAPSTTTPEDYFNSLLYDKSMVDTKQTSEYDRWSFLVSYDEYTGVMVEGEYKSFGYFLDQVPSPDYSVRVCFVYEGSPMAKAGIERGYELVKINGTDVMTFIRNETINAELAKETNRFVFADRQGNLLPEKTISAAVVKINPMIRKETYTVDGKKVGYIVYNSFITASEETITNALNELKDVDDLILDLRYNGGGDVSVADHICEYLLPSSVGTDSVNFAKYVYSKRTNDNYKDIGLRDEFRKIKRNSNALNLSRLFVIVSDMTASASEEVINSLKPFVNEIVLVGTQTNGKPVGMLAIPYPVYNQRQIDAGMSPDWVIAAINFRIDNKNGGGSYFAGISPTYKISDDLYHDFGVDVKTLEGEGCLQAVIKYIQTGGFPTTVSVKSVEEHTPRLIQLKGLQIHAGCL